MVGIVTTGGRPGGHNGNLLLGLQLVGQVVNLLRGNAAELRGPFGRLRRLVIGAEHVIAEITLRIGALRHGVGVETDSAAGEEIPVDERVGREVVFGDQHIGDAEDKRVVLTGIDGNPLGVQHGIGVVVTRVHGDELGAGLLDLFPVPGLSAAT